MVNPFLRHRKKKVTGSDPMFIAIKLRKFAAYEFVRRHRKLEFRIAAETREAIFANPKPFAFCFGL